MRIAFIGILLLYLLPYHSIAQNRISWQEIVEQYFDNTDIDGGPDEQLQQVLYEIYCNPLDLNMVSEEDLEEMWFLDERQIKDILFYRDTHFPMFSTGELVFIKSLGFKDRQLLSTFCKVDVPEEKKKYPLTLKRLVKNIKGEVVVRTDIPFYKKSGQKEYPDSVLEKSPNKKYEGSGLAGGMRVSLQSLKNLYVGLQMQKDAGERNVDYISGYAMLKDIQLSEKVILKDFIGGSYLATFGLGLVMGSNYSFGKIMSISNLSGIDRGFRRHSSNLESGYLTGGATCLQVGNVSVSAFAAHNNIDGTYRSDSTGVTAIKTDGLHRTPLEISKKGNMSVNNFGGNVNWNITKRIKLSGTGLYTHYSLPIAPEYKTASTLYKKFNVQGQDFMSFSLAYSYLSSKWRFTGETALSIAKGLEDGHGKQTDWATLGCLQFIPNNKNTFTLIGRRYGAKYVAPYGKTFGNNSRPQNEQGAMVGWKNKMINYLVIEMYGDVAYYPWLKSGITNDSWGYELFLQTTYNLSNDNTLLVRYHMKSKQQNREIDEYDVDAIDYEDGGILRTLTFNTTNSIKIQHSVKFKSGLQLRTLVNGNLVGTRGNQQEKGGAISETLAWSKEIKKRPTPLGVSLSMVYFNTETYAARVYGMEPSLLYSFGMVSYYGHGIRGVLRASIPVINNLSLNMKFAFTKFFDRDKISSGTEEISASHREDLSLQLRYKF